ncbi:MAG: ATP-binding protein [Erysipelotrichaceae bacterium]|nr:ATP-binding protein [Erysipelotrichaceae bacterium]
MTDIELLKNDEYLKQFIKDETFLREHSGTFLRVYEARKKCEGCKGLFACSQPSPGERLALADEGVLFEEIEYCPYALAKRNSESVLSRYLYCDVTKSLADLDLNNVRYTDEQKKLYLALAAILHEKADRGLYICGDLGVGKTYLCTALANSLVKKGKKVAFVKVSNFFNEMKSYFGTASEMVDRNISILKNAEYLFLDDIGSETVSQFVRDDILFRILDYRLENKLITIFTSNLNKEELLKHYQYDRREQSNLMNARRLLERIDILSDNFVLSGPNMRRG